MSNSNQPPRPSGSIEHYDAVVIGAGVSGMYALHHLRELGFSVLMEKFKNHFDAAGLGAVISLP